ncbi:MAG: cyclase family protein [Bryobacteraceae bacterium]
MALGIWSVLGLLAQAALCAQAWSPPPPDKRCPSVWGSGDERGSANYVRPETVLKAARLIREGTIYELGRVLESAMPVFGLRRFSIYTARTVGPVGANRAFANEELVAGELGQVGTQLDGLTHVGIDGLLYNCTKVDDIATRTGFTRLGVEKVGALFARGILLDIAGFKGVETLEAAYEITPADLQGALRRQGLTIGRGDAVLIRTGWGKLWMVDNARYNRSSPGIGVPAAEWLVETNPLLIGADNSGVEVQPNPNKALANPVHQILIPAHGIFLLENLDLEALARDRVSEFAFIVQPLKIKGGTGSTVAPIAVK